jgi:hypothetical protein
MEAEGGGGRARWSCRGEREVNAGADARTKDVPIFSRHFVLEIIGNWAPLIVLAKLMQYFKHAFERLRVVQLF